MVDKRSPERTWFLYTHSPPAVTKEVEKLRRVGDAAAWIIIITVAILTTLLFEKKGCYHSDIDTIALISNTTNAISIQVVIVMMECKSC